jgi:hypothetical protein
VTRDSFMIAFRSPLIVEAIMAVRLTPPTKNVFYISVGLGVLSIVLYLLGVFGVTGGGFQAVSHYAYWLAVLGWLAMTVGVAFKGI